jgi:trehalose-6-phosphate synthase
VASPSRERVEAYQTLRDEVEVMVGRINGEHGEVGYSPVHYLHQSFPREEMAALYLAADVMLVTPLRDGMNLVAKEYVAAQNPSDPGVLVLSRFAGAARQLEAALLVNPHDGDAMADALDTALRMPLSERQARWRALWSAIEHRSPAVWGRSFVATLTRAMIAQPKAADMPMLAQPKAAETAKLEGLRDLKPGVHPRRLN